jgi:K+-transporting ATPase A subunit
LTVAGILKMAGTTKHLNEVFIIIKMTMNLKVILVAFVLLCFSGCVNDDPVETKTQQNSLGLDIIISFDDTSDPHKMSGKNTTNTIYGEFE